MSDWKSRAQSIDIASAPTSDWRSRATNIDQLPGQPSVASMGSPDGSTPDSNSSGILQTAIDAISHPLRVLGKAAQYPRDVVAGPATGAVISAIAGKPVFTGQEAQDAYNPLTTKTFPSTHEMLTRGGLQDSPSLSDMLQKIPDDNRSPILQLAKTAGKHFYADPNQNNPWYQPVKGGALDPTAGSLVDFATNPLNWSSVNSLIKSGESVPTAATTALQAAKKGESPSEAVLDMLKSPDSQVNAEAPSKFFEMAQNLQPSTGAKLFGKKLYESLLQPVENQGSKFGKTDIADTLYNAGIKTPLGLSDKAANANNALMEARNAILQKAGDAGGTVSMQNSVAPTESSIAEAIASRDPVKTPVAQKMGDLTNEYKTIETGTPSQPPTSSVVDTGLMDQNGRPITKIVETPGSDAIPGKQVTPMEASGYKTSLYNSLPSTQYSETVKSGYGNNLRAQLASGLKSEVEKSVGKTLGQPASEAVTNLNSEAGKLLSTPQGQLTAQNNASRMLNQVLVPTRTDAVLAALREGDPAKAVAIKHLINALNVGSMPAGYGIRKAAESPLGPMLDMTLRQQLSNQGENQ